MVNSGITVITITVLCKGWCWQTRATRLEVSQDHQTWYHSIC